MILASDGKRIAPAGRSYENGDWESVAGPFPLLERACSADDCNAMLPELAAGETYNISQACNCHLIKIKYDQIQMTLQT